jgi:integrase
LTNSRERIEIVTSLIEDWRGWRTRGTFHAMRYTCTTLLLGAGEPVHVVSKRLGHARVQITLAPTRMSYMQKQAAATMGALLHG